MLKPRQLTALAAAVILTGLAAPNVMAQSDLAAPSPAGAWFGIARSCTPGGRFPNPPGTVNESICREACGGGKCPAATFPVDEVAMTPTFFADGRVIATDHLTLFDAHPPSVGKWEAAGKAVIDGKEYQRFQATILWLLPRSPQDVDPRNPQGLFQGVGRPRFVFYLDPTNPDVVQGYIQPFLFTMTDNFGQIILQPNTPFPAADPVPTLPTVCDPTAKSNPYCAGTLMFVIRRLQAK